MTLTVKRKKLRLRFWLPSCFAAGICMRCAKRELKKSGFALIKTHALKKALKREIRKAKVHFSPLYLVEVETADGMTVKIKL